ncbi:hypothetical protein DL96DRAFT_1774555 [Flagelloscypha sp. PMI_526]|nr:hypothetical protein DL96DRAFT_1774555 [Flagelloscypha sp. PMI_526]
MAHPTLHKRFNAPDADISIISSDNVLFRLHSRNLSVCSGAFPVDMDATSKSEPAKFEESSEVLGYLFAFLYADEDHPTLAECPFNAIIAIEIAANKWLIPAAKNTCYLRAMSASNTSVSLLTNLWPDVQRLVLSKFHADDPILNERAMNVLNHPTADCSTLIHNDEKCLGRIYTLEVFAAWRLFKLKWLEQQYNEMRSESKRGHGSLSLSEWAKKKPDKIAIFTECLREFVPM